MQIQFGDGKLGIPEFGPYNAIHVGAAAEHIPQALVEQLKVFLILIVFLAGVICSIAP